MGVYERTPELHSLELATAPCFQCTFRFIWGYTNQVPIRTPSDFIIRRECGWGLAAYSPTLTDNDLFRFELIDDRMFERCHARRLGIEIPERIE